MTKLHIKKGDNVFINTGKDKGKTGRVLEVLVKEQRAIVEGRNMFVMWLGERITDKGIGNGISFLILIGIIARFPDAVIKEFASRLTDAGGGLIMNIQPFPE